MPKECYREFKAYAGMSIEHAVAELQEHHQFGRKVCLEFNGVYLYSDTVTLDGAYMAICGKTKAEYEKYQAELREERRRKDEKHKARIPQLVEEWKAKGREVLDEKYWSLWDEILPIRLGDLYHGMELPMCLDIVKALNEGCSLEEAKRIIDDQGHSYMSYHLVRNMVKEFCDRGIDFAEFVKV